MPVQNNRKLGVIKGLNVYPLNGRHLQEPEDSCILVYGPKSDKDMREKVIRHYAVRDIVSTITALMENGLEEDLPPSVEWMRTSNKDKLRKVKTHILGAKYFKGVTYEDLNLCVDIARKHFTDTAKHLAKRRKKVKSVNVYMDPAVSAGIASHFNGYRNKKFQILPMGRVDLLKSKRPGILVTSNRKIIDRLSERYTARVAQTQDTRVPMNDLPFIVYVQQHRGPKVLASDLEADDPEQLDCRSTRREHRKTHMRDATKDFTAKNRESTRLRRAFNDHLRRIAHWYGDTRRFTLAITLTPEGKIIAHDRLSLLSENFEFVGPAKSPDYGNALPHKAFKAANDSDAAMDATPVDLFLEEERHEKRARRHSGSHRPSFARRS